MSSFHVKILQSSSKVCEVQVVNESDMYVGLFTCTALPYMSQCVFTLTLGHVKGHATFDVTWNLYVVF